MNIQMRLMDGGTQVSYDDGTTWFPLPNGHTDGVTQIDPSRDLPAASVAARSATDDMHVESSMLATGPGFITHSGTPTEEEFTHIREHFGDPRANVRPEDYYSFRMIASGDGLDSYFTRQDIETSFPNFVRDLKKGQSVLGSHQMATFSYGSSYDGEVLPADDSRSEYEGVFYPQWDTPDLRTRNWLIGKYFMGRDVTVNGQSTNDLIRSIELGNVRKASISFMVGQYVCGIDGRDLISTMFGPMPDEECNHFPGIAYDGGIAWALMKNNTLVETSLVYKNASPSSMLLRKAEALASRGSLSARDIEQLEGRFQVRLPRFERQIWTPNVNGQTASNSAGTWSTTVTLPAESGATNGSEDTDMAGRRRGGDDAARELAREALTAEPEPEQEESAGTDGEAADDAAPETETTPTDGNDEAPAAPDTENADGGDAGAEAEGDTAATDATAEAPAGEPESAAAEADVTEAAPENDDTAEAAPAAEAQPEEHEEESAEPTSESTREDDVISAFVTAADRLVSALTRNPNAFDTDQLSVTARAERTIDLALIDAGCDTTVGSHVARTFDTRNRALTEALGEPLTVEAIRTLHSKANLGDTLYEELVKDAVAARTGAQGEGFNDAKYRDLLMGARDVAFVKEEIASWKDVKKERFTPGRSVVPRQVADVKTTKEERKSLPEAPAALPASSAKSGASTMGSILEPRKK